MGQRKTDPVRAWPNDSLVKKTTKEKTIKRKHTASHRRMRHAEGFCGASAAGRAERMRIQRSLWRPQRESAPWRQDSHEITTIGQFQATNLGAKPGCREGPTTEQVIRVIDVDGNLWFGAADVLVVLGFSRVGWTDWI
jgi:hypothetical protein